MQFPGRFNPYQLKTLTKRVKIWRRDARARGVIIDQLKWRNLNNKPRGLRPDPFRIGRRCFNAWRNSRIKQPWSFSSSSGRATRSGIPFGNCPQCSADCKHGVARL